MTEKTGMLDKSALIPAVSKKLEKLPVGHCLDLRTYKRNRSVLIIKTGPDEFEFREDGFEKKNFTIQDQKIKSTLKKMLKREFPRSNKIRVYDLGEFHPEKADRDLKTL
ncbi:MAG: hypothetical protein ACLFMP_02600 [Desulfonatronovibrionaceae bacterium]